MGGPGGEEQGFLNYLMLSILSFPGGYSWLSSPVKYPHTEKKINLLKESSMAL